MRLDKYISSQRTDLSRADVKKLIRQGRVSAAGKTASDPGMQVGEDCEVTLDGERIHYKEHIYIMLNKPAGYVCSAREGNSPTVYDLIPPELNRRGLFPAGRLDKDTEGFVLMTDDGQLAHDMLSPGRHVPKRYHVRLAEPYRPEYAERFAAGITIDGGEVCLPAEAYPDPGDPFAFTLILHEGKFHQVKRMAEAVGNRVVYLRREAIGNLDIAPGLGLGECLELMHKDVEKLLAAQSG